MSVDDTYRHRWATKRGSVVQKLGKVAFITTSKTKAVEDQKERTLRQGIMESRAFIPVLKHIFWTLYRHGVLNCSRIADKTSTYPVLRRTTVPVV